MKALIIGGCGHIGTYLAPRLVENGYETAVVTRGKSEPYAKGGIWNWIERVSLDRDTLETEGTFGRKIAGLGADIVIDLISFKPESAVDMFENLNGRVSHFLYCSTVWEHATASVVPAAEHMPRSPFGEYGINKAKSSEYLHSQFNKTGFPETVIMPGHITGPGWDIIGPCGNTDPQVFGKIGRGEKIYLVNAGMETLHNVHADDVAQVFMNAIIWRNKALGESIHAVAPEAITMRGMAERLYRWFGKEPNIEYLPWDAWCETVSDPSYIEATQLHMAHCNNYSIEKAVKLINYRPRFTICEAVYDGVISLIERGIIKVDANFCRG